MSLCSLLNLLVAFYVLLSDLEWDFSPTNNCSYLKNELILLFSYVAKTKNKKKKKKIKKKQKKRFLHLCFYRRLDYATCILDSNICLFLLF